MFNEIVIIDRNEKVRWEQEFPSIYGNKKYNGNNARQTALAIKRLQKYRLFDIRKVADKAGMMYFCSQNHHDHKWGINTIRTPEGGGVIAQANTYEECVEKALNEFGIHPIFIWGVDVDGF